MSKLSAADIAFLRAILAVPEGPHGWRVLPPVLLQMALEFRHRALLRVWPAEHKVRLSKTAKIILEWTV